MTGRARLARDAGSITLEVAILAPALIVLIAAMVIVGRVQVAAAGVEHAAAVAARDASLARTIDGARAAALAGADRELADAGCASSQVDVDVTGMARPVGQAATVRVTITCTVPFDDLAVPGLPGSRTLTGSATSPVDIWRQR